MHHPVPYCCRFAFTLLLLFTPATCFSWPAKVVSVNDGDTITVLRDGRQVKIRLYGIDSPEKGQDFGQKARELTAALVAGRSVDIEQMDTDRYGRIVGLVEVNGQSLNRLIVQNGFAWVYPQYCNERFCDDWIQSEATARKSKKGLWKDPVVVPPWEWRAAQRDGKQFGPQTEPPVILIGEKPNNASEDSLLVKIRRVLTPSISSGNGGSPNEGQYRCDGRTHCSQMTSCEEATFFLENCPGIKMDGNNDGVPCERQWCH